MTIALGPVELVVLQGTSFCNLNCSYCYLSEESRKKRGAMPLDAVEVVFTRILQSRYVDRRLHVSWHSGEPLVLGPGYYRDAIDRVLELTRALRPDVEVRFDIQTNGTLIDAAWCEFFKAYRDVLSVGVSCDGPDFLHDAHRQTWGGKPTHRQTVRGMDLLCASGIVFDVTAVVSEMGLGYPVQFLDFFRPYSCHLGQFHFNLLDEFAARGPVEDWTARYAAKYAGFLAVLLEAAGDPADTLLVRNFSHFLDRVFAEPAQAERHSARSLSRPLKTLNVDLSGNVSTFYAGLTADVGEDIYRDGRGLTLGNLLVENLDEIARSAKLRRIADDFERSHRACEAHCEFAPLCPGGYNLIKHKRFGTYEATETPECFVHVKTFARVMLDDIRRNIRPGEAHSSGSVAQEPAIEAVDSRPRSDASNARTEQEISS